MDDPMIIFKDVFLFTENRSFDFHPKSKERSFPLPPNLDYKFLIEQIGSCKVFRCVYLQSLFPGKQSWSKFAVFWGENISVHIILDF